MKSNISLSFSVAFDKSDMTGDMNKDTLEARISGLSFYVDIKNYTEYTIEGGYIKAEPSNVHDPNAIAIYHESGKHLGYISKKCILDVKKFTDGDNAPCLIYIVPFIDNNGEIGLKGVVRIFRYYEGEAEYVNNAMNHFIHVYSLKFHDDLNELELKLQENKQKMLKVEQNLLIPNMDDEGHLTFKGIPINGPIEKFEARVKNIGFEPDGVSLVGRFAGLKVKVYPGCSEDMSIVYSVFVKSEQENSWASLKRKYINLRELYINKYGNPTKDIHIFVAPYDEGDGDELEATENQKCFYLSKFSVSGGEVSIYISKRSIMFYFEDAINKKLVDGNNEEENFDDDYNAYDDI